MLPGFVVRKPTGAAQGVHQPPPYGNVVHGPGAPGYTQNVGHGTDFYGNPATNASLGSHGSIPGLVLSGNTGATPPKVGYGTDLYGNPATSASLGSHDLASFANLASLMDGGSGGGDASHLSDDSTLYDCEVGQGFHPASI
jgi:hypothetical protein